MANAKYAIACAFLWDSLLSYLGRQTTKYLFQSTANDSLNPPCHLHIFHKVVFLQYWFVYIWGKVFSIDAGVIVCHNSCCKASEGRGDFGNLNQKLIPWLVLISLLGQHSFYTPHAAISSCMPRAMEQTLQVFAVLEASAASGGLSELSRTHIQRCVGSSEIHCQYCKPHGKHFLSIWCRYFFYPAPFSYLLFRHHILAILNNISIVIQCFLL